ncbi:lipoyl protein ligase domain-containing protein [Nonomuraea rubra]|uniref:lipoyl protein ligase domain-containing protein n=1 Tax=Nonomuraea rubra TaxID=46180 RepID=UPI003CD06F54
MGRRTPISHLPDPTRGIPVIETGRGGQLTYHGPGQLVGYLVVKLDESEGIVDYVREVELRLVEALGSWGCRPSGATRRRGSELLTGSGRPRPAEDHLDRMRQSRGRHQPRVRAQRRRRPDAVELGPWPAGCPTST